MTPRIPCMFLLTATVWTISPAVAGTVAYYSFEGSTSGGAAAPWRQDSGGNNPLSGLSGTVSQAGSIIDPVPFGQLANARQANLSANGYFYTAAPSGDLTTMGSFTVEAFVKWNGPYVTGGVSQRAMIASQWDATGNLRSYQFGIDTAGKLFVNLNPGGADSGDHIHTSSISIPTGHDYYVGVSFDRADPARGIKFYALKLADDQAALQISEVSHSIPTLRPPTARLVIGEAAYSGTTKRFVGLLDEVKISNVPLSRGELLISGPGFRDFSGINQSGATNALYQQAISIARKDVSWNSLEPVQGAWQSSVLTAIGNDVLALQAQGVAFLPVLDYTAQWAADKSARQWDLGNDRWAIQPRSDGKVDRLYYKKVGGSWVLQSTTLMTDFSKLPPASVAHWTNYVRQVVDFLKAPPYNVRRFQIWNEAHPRSGFWWGDMNDYMQRVHIPAANIIHAAGCEVVYGGWPDIGSDNGLPELLDANDAWGTVDVLDVHYRGTQMYTLYRNAADSRGYPNIGVWETEVGWTAYPGFISKFYPAALATVLGYNDWTYADRYKAFYFTNWTPNDPASGAHMRGLYTGSSMAPHGLVLQNLASLLSGLNLSRYTGATLSPATTIHGFRLGWRNRKIILVVAMNTAFYTGNTTATLALPIPRSSIAKLERVDLTGTRADLTGSLVTGGSGTTVSLDIQDAAGSAARAWNDATSDTRTFYVQITLQ